MYSRQALSDSVREGKLRQDCNNLHHSIGDIEDNELQKEIERFHHFLTLNQKLNTPIDFLTYIHNNGLQGNYPNFSIALRMLLTTPVSVASAERSFSKLKLIKAYNRTTMADSRLSDLATISLEHETANKLDLDELVMDFACAKARRKPL